ncbi:hypothetical protein EMIT0P395_10163 [Pseudomonas sp. IT-P395]
MRSVYGQALPDKFFGVAGGLIEVSIALFLSIEHRPLAVFLQ